LKVTLSNTRSAISYWLTPVKLDNEWSAQEVVENYVGKRQIYAFSDKTLAKNRMKVKDWICFYAGQQGVIAHAEVATSPQRRLDPSIRNPATYPWVINLSSVEIYPHRRVVINAALRSTLDAFQNKDPKKHWAWLVQTTREISKNDFKRLTHR
jgi:hypothetical protein